MQKKRKKNLNQIKIKEIEKKLFQNEEKKLD